MDSPLILLPSEPDMLKTARFELDLGRLTVTSKLKRERGRWMMRPASWELLCWQINAAA